MILGFEILDFVFLIAISLVICVTVCTLAMEASVLFTPAFLFLFPVIIVNFPSVSPNEAIGLAITIEFFGYTSSVIGYWMRKQIDVRVAFRVLAYTVPLAVAGRLAAYFVPEQGLLMVFGLVLIGLAVIIFRAYQGEVRHTCLLCGDSLIAMRYEKAAAGDNPGPDAPASAPPAGPAGGVKDLVFNAFDRMVLFFAGAFAGLVGVAIGEISNTFLTVRKELPVKVSTGTSALVLHVTILSALAANLLVLWSGLEIFAAEQIEIPWTIAFVLAPVVIVGGQIGSFINSRLSDRALIRLLIGAYTVIGVFVMGRILIG